MVKYTSALQRSCQIEQKIELRIVLHIPGIEVVGDLLCVTKAIVW